MMIKYFYRVRSVVLTILLVVVGFHGVAGAAGDSRAIPAIIPKPVSLQIERGVFTVTPATRIVAGADLEEAATPRAWTFAAR